MRIASSIAAQLDLDPLLQEIVDTAAELVGAEFGGILVLDEEDPTRYEVLRIHGWPTPCGLAQPQGRGILGLLHKDEQLEALRERLAGMRSVLVAYSGGVDSTFQGGVPVGAGSDPRPR